MIIAMINFYCEITDKITDRFNNEIKIIKKSINIISAI